MLVVCEEDGPNNNQNQRDGGARIVANDHLDDPASSVPHFVIIRDGGCRIILVIICNNLKAGFGPSDDDDEDDVDDEADEYFSDCNE